MKLETTKTLILGYILLVLFLFSAFALLPRVAGATNTTTVTVGNDPLGVAITPNGAYAYVANKGDGSVSVISTSSNTVTATIPVGSNPWEVAVAPNGAFAYVTNEGSDTVSVIDTTTNKVTATIIGFSDPYGVAITPNGEYAYVTNFGGNSISVVDTTINKITTTINGLSNPWDVAVTPDGAYAYVTNEGSLLVSVIDTNTNKITTTVYVGGGSYGIAIAPYGAFVYVTNNLSKLFSVISTATNSVTATATVGANPFGIAITPSGDYAYVANHGSGTVSVINIATDTITATLTVGTNPYGVAITPNGAYAYVTNEGSGTVSVISVLVAPTVTSTPGTVDQGQTSNLTSSSVTTGTSPYNYLWFAKAPGNSSYSPISGATSPSYSFAPTSSNTTGLWNFELQVIDTSGMRVNSLATRVMVNAAPFVTISPATVFLDVGQSATFNAAASGGSGAYASYQWYLNGSAQSGKTTSTFSLVPASTGSYSIYATVTDTLDATSTQSSAASVTVNASPTLSIAPAGPSLMDVGQVQGFTATVVGGSGSLSYQWYLDSAMVGSNSSTYSFTAGVSHSVTCKVTDSASVPVTSPASNSVPITVSALPTVTVAPVGPLSMEAGQSQTFTASPSGGSGNINYQWYVSGSFIAGATSPNYSFSGSVGSFSITCKVTDSATSPVTSLASNAVSVTVTPSASPTPTPTPTLKPTPTPTPTPTATPAPSANPTMEMTTPTPTPESSQSANPSPHPSATAVPATQGSGKTVDLTISGNITLSQMSNVTISLNQSATTTTVSFNVTGQNGTTATSNMTIPKSAVSYGTNPIIYIDNQPAQSQGYCQDSNNYYVWYTIHFSTHKVSILFTTTSPSQSPAPQASLPIGVIYGVTIVLAIGVVVAVLLVLRKSKKGKILLDETLQEKKVINNIL